MNFARKYVCRAGLISMLGLLMFGGASHAQALDDGSSPTYLKLDNASSRNYFVRFGYTYFKPNSKSSLARDVTGPAIARGEAQDLVMQNKITTGTSAAAKTCHTTGPTDYSWTDSAGSLNATCNFWGTKLASVLDDGLDADGQLGMGIPPILKSSAAGAGLFTIQAGMFLDEDHAWAVEPYVFGIPPENKVYGAGNNSLAGKVVLTSQQLPLTVIVNRYFGDKNATIRGSLGLAATYAVFFNARSTQALDDYSGGQTDIKINNAFGYGPFAGLQYKLADHWHLNAQVGYVKLKTSATLTTKNTQLTTDGKTLGAVVQDFTKLANDPSSTYYETAKALCSAVCDVTDGVYTFNPALSGTASTARFLAAIQRANGGNLGTYARRQDVNLDPYVFSVSVGYEF